MFYNLSRRQISPPALNSFETSSGFSKAEIWVHKFRKNTTVVPLDHPPTHPATPAPRKSHKKSLKGALGYKEGCHNLLNKIVLFFILSFNICNFVFLSPHKKRVSREHFGTEGDVTSCWKFLVMAPQFCSLVVYCTLFNSPLTVLGDFPLYLATLFCIFCYISLGMSPQYCLGVCFLVKTSRASLIFDAKALEISKSK